MVRAHYVFVVSRNFFFVDETSNFRLRYKMDIPAVTTSIKSVIEQLALVQPVAGSDEYDQLIDALKELVAMANVLSMPMRATKKRPRPGPSVRSSSGSSDEIRVISDEVETVVLHSDSDEDVLRALVVPKATVSLRDVLSSVNGEVKIINDKPFNLLNKRCVVKVRRMDMTGAGSSSAVCTPKKKPKKNSKEHDEQDEFGLKDFLASDKGKVSPSRNCLRPYTYQDYVKRLREVCHLQ